MHGYSKPPWTSKKVEDLYLANYTYFTPLPAPCKETKNKTTNIVHIESGPYPPLLLNFLGESNLFL